MKNTKQTTKHKRSVAQHTAGEWGVSPKDDYYIYSKGDDSTIAKVYYGNEANARLIASAPELLQMLDTLQRRGMTGVYSLQVKDLIAKAKGE